MSGHLVATDLTKRYAGLMAVDHLDLAVRPGEVVGLIGPNGAGKTTTFNCLTGVVPMTDGSVVLDGRDVTRLSPTARAQLGMARTFQQAQLFRHLTVEENLLLGRHRHYGANPFLAALGLAARAERRARDYVGAVAEECGIGRVLEAPVGDLPYGTQRMVEVARALAAEPALLLLDEPGAGMDPAESAYFGSVLGRISRERGLSVLIIEHDVAMVLSLCDRVYVLDFGLLLMSGTPAEVRNDPRVRAAYLGTSGDLLGARGG
ncbi:MAG: ABC transporter ATP-binding protein [Acidimicrobiales bacterium]